MEPGKRRRAKGATADEQKSKPTRAATSPADKQKSKSTRAATKGPTKTVNKSTRAATKGPAKTVKKTENVPNLDSILRVMIEHEIVLLLRWMLRGNKHEHFAKQWGESTEEKIRQLREHSDRSEIYRDMIQFVATRFTNYLDKIHFFHDTVYDMTMEDKKRAIEALLDVCVKRVLTYKEKYSWKTSNQWQGDEADNLDKEIALRLSLKVKELARE